MSLFGPKDDRPRYMTAGMHGYLVNLRALVKSGKLNHHEYNMTVEDIDDLYKTCQSLIESRPAGPERATDIHGDIDELIAKDNAARKVPSSCKVGCSACCHMRADITEDEARLIARRIKKDRLEIDGRLLQSQVAFSGDDHDWFSQGLGQSKCVLLSDKGECRVYEHRPASCRLYHVVSAPKLCSVNGGRVAKQVCIDAEILASAAGNSQPHGPLPGMLFKALKAKV